MLQLINTWPLSFQELMDGLKFWLADNDIQTDVTGENSTDGNATDEKFGT